MALAEAPQLKELVPSIVSLLSVNEAVFSEPTFKPPVAQAVERGSVRMCCPPKSGPESQGANGLPGALLGPSPLFSVDEEC